MYNVCKHMKSCLSNAIDMYIDRNNEHNYCNFRHTSRSIPLPLSFFAVLVPYFSCTFPFHFDGLLPYGKVLWAKENTERVRKFCA